MQYSMGIDIGTTNVKCVLFGPEVSVVAEASKEYKTKIPKPSWAQQNPDDWWNGVKETIQKVLDKSKIHPADVKVISVSSQAPTVLPIDKEGRPLHDALIWMDRRSREEIEILRETISEERVFEITGNKLDSYFNLSELMWFIRKKPEIMEKCYKLLQINGYINMKLTGEYTIDASHASICELCDIRKRVWSEELLQAIGGNWEWMPRIVECTDVIGHLTRQAAEETGLTTETVVLGGAVDATAAALEVGVHKEGKAAEMTGTSSVIMIGYEQLICGKELSYLEGIRKDTVVLFGAMNTAGGSLKWFRDKLFGGETPENDAYDRINREIEAGTSEPSKIIYLPYLSGERAPIWNPDARGTFIGLTTETSRAEFMRAIMEGTCFALQHNLEQAYQMGIPVERLICCGGCAKSDIWLKIKASVIGKEIVVPKTSQGAPGGLGYINAAYLGEYKTPEEASEANFKIKKIVEPVVEWEKTYKAMYQIYKDSYESLKEQYRAIGQL